MTVIDFNAARERLRPPSDVCVVCGADAPIVDLHATGGLCDRCETNAATAMVEAEANPAAVLPKRPALHLVPSGDPSNCA